MDGIMVCGVFLILFICAALFLRGVVFPAIADVTSQIDKAEEIKTKGKGLGCTGTILAGIFGIASIACIGLLLPAVGTLMVFQNDPEINPSGQLIESTEYYGVSPTWAGYYVVEVSDDLFRLDVRVWDDWVKTNTSGDYGKLEDYRAYKPVSHYLYVPGKCYDTRGSVTNYPAQYSKLYSIPDQPGMSCWRAPYLSVPYNHYKGDPQVIRITKISPAGRELIFEKIGKNITVWK